MQPQTIIALAVRLFAIWLAVSTVQLIAIASSIQQNYQNGAAWVLYGVPCITLILVVLLWRFPLSVARKLLPEISQTELIKLPARDAAAAGAAILGLWILVSSLPHVVGDVGILLFASDAVYFDSAHIIQATATAIQFLVGIYLLIKPWNIANRIFPAAK